MQLHCTCDTSVQHLLTADVVAPTPEEVAAVEAEVSNKELDRVIEAIKLTVRSSGRPKVDTARSGQIRNLGKSCEWLQFFLIESIQFH
jgi:hypothetical protein